MKSVYLCGFMGCGKSTIGLALSKELGYQFYDLDEYIAKQEGMSISSIFAARGELYFRNLEGEALEAFAQKGNSVIATGGGALVNPDNAKRIGSSGVIVYLQLPFDICYNRIAGDTNRPLVMNNTYEQLYQLYNSRIQMYEANAHITFSAEKSVLKCAKSLCNILRPLL